MDWISLGKGVTFGKKLTSRPLQLIMLVDIKTMIKDDNIDEK